MRIPVISKSSVDGDANYSPPKAFPIGPFTKYAHNPILKPNPDWEFESGYLYNASAIVVDGYVFLLYRAQNKQKESSVGLAWSEDGFQFKKYHKPIIWATEPWEQGGGIEDPRIVRDPKSKLFIVTYTAYDLSTARLCVATSEDLFHWKKYPSFVPHYWQDLARTSDNKTLIRNEWLKSGAIFTERNKDGKYYMIWGDSDLHLAESDDLVHWSLTSGDFNANKFAQPRFNFENKLIESGPAPIKLNNGKNQWVFFYNASTTGGEDIPRETYTISEMLIDYDHIRDGPVARLEKPILKPEQRNEVEGQVNKVVFCEGIVQFKGKWLLYYGQGDSELGVAYTDV
ncbi:glycoside hydrolase family 130 protein [Suhomyces tanzawaensis NRRL Y-17324]|uniref:Glycoside hydrolase family 130 protein n=1 Tax=Suhomyces tanzawaensis NRRL Y-17324 TaxID=984487 RepID=A0A1E4SKU4_9ASCO|nr:glycoside hydrolase family 130 protein [Suhomyces tanzawaensis NRRL Y-17324]ODV80124.1 glycoside hydrolase family 130 protein [Suhomyces tanzawaensis NRRL Y-17324]